MKGYLQFILKHNKLQINFRNKFLSEEALITHYLKGTKAFLPLIKSISKPRPHPFPSPNHHVSPTQFIISPGLTVSRCRHVTRLQRARDKSTFHPHSGHKREKGATVRRISRWKSRLDSTHTHTQTFARNRTRSLLRLAKAFEIQQFAANHL